MFLRGGKLQHVSVYGLAAHLDTSPFLSYSFKQAFKRGRKRNILLHYNVVFLKTSLFGLT